MKEYLFMNLKNGTLFKGLFNGFAVGCYALKRRIFALSKPQRKQFRRRLFNM